MGAQRDIAIRHLYTNTNYRHRKYPRYKLNQCRLLCTTVPMVGVTIAVVARKSEVKREIVSLTKIRPLTATTRVEYTAVDQYYFVQFANVEVGPFASGSFAARPIPQHTIVGNNQPTKVANAIDCCFMEQLRGKAKNKNRKKKNEAHEQQLLPS